MAVTAMRLINIIGQLDVLDEVIFACGRAGCAQPDDALTFFSDVSDFSTIQENNPYTELLGMLESAAGRLNAELTPVDAEITHDIDRPALAAFARTVSLEVADLTRRRSELALEIEAISRDLEQFEHFRGLGISLDEILNCKMIKFRFGRLPKDSLEKLHMFDTLPYVLFFPAERDDEYFWGVYFAPLDFASEVDHIFSGLYFERLRIPAAVGTPEEVVRDLQSKRDAIRGRIDALDAEIRDYWAARRDDCLRTYAQLKRLSYYFSVRRYAARYKNEFILTGWVPARDEPMLCAALHDIDGIDYSVEEPDDPHHTPPVKLRNSKVFRPFQFFVNMYGLPRHNEIDPTKFVSITYILLFGIMFGDVGQGLIVALAGWLMWRLKKMEIGRILVPCGFSSALFGVVFGSVFGFEHLLDPLYRAVGFEEKPIEVLSSSTTTVILLVAAGIGLVLIVISMLLNIRSSLRRRDFEEGICGPSGAAGLVFYVSIIAGLVLTLAGYSVMTLPYVLCLIVFPLLIIYLKEPLGRRMEGREDWKPESWGGYLVQSFFELLEIMISYLSNTMSFLRVGAFVLIHAGMMMAVFKLAEMSGGVAFWIIVAVGNAIVLVMEALLVAIQVMRLEFYELFSRYYKGDGRAFKPISADSGDKTYSDS